MDRLGLGLGLIDRLIDLLIGDDADDAAQVVKRQRCLPRLPALRLPSAARHDEARPLDDLRGSAMFVPPPLVGA